MNVICLGGSVVANAFTWELVRPFLQARFSGASVTTAVWPKPEAEKPGKRDASIHLACPAGLIQSGGDAIGRITCGRKPRVITSPRSIFEVRRLRRASVTTRIFRSLPRELHREELLLTHF